MPSTAQCDALTPTGHPYDPPRARRSSHSLDPRIPLQERLLPDPDLLTIPRSRLHSPQTRHLRHRPVAARQSLHPGQVPQSPGPGNVSAQEDPPRRVHRARRDRVRALRIRTHDGRGEGHPQTGGAILGHEEPCAETRGREGVQGDVSQFPPIWVRCVEYGA